MKNRIVCHFTRMCAYAARERMCSYARTLRRTKTNNKVRTKGFICQTFVHINAYAAEMNKNEQE